MKYSAVRDQIVAITAGIAAMFAMLIVRGLTHIAIHGPTERIAAFLSPHLARSSRLDASSSAFDTVTGALIGVLLAVLVARFTQSQRWVLWVTFSIACIPNSSVAP